MENTKYFNKNSQSHIKIKVPLSTFCYLYSPTSHILCHLPPPPPYVIYNFTEPFKSMDQTSSW